MRNLLFILVLSVSFGQYTFSAQDLNPTSSTYSEEIGPETYPGVVTLYYFGHQY